MATEKVIGTRIKESRTSANLTQADLGKKLGIGKSSISEWESNKRSPDFDKLEEMATILGVSFHYLVGWSDDPNYPSMGAMDAIYISRPTGNSSTDELRKQLHDMIDQLDDEDLQTLSNVTIKFARK